MTHTTTTKTAGDGAAITSKHVPAQREHGMDRLREDECYHLTALIESGLNEAVHLVRKVQSKAFSRTIDHDGGKGTAPLDHAEATKILGQALDCAQVATGYLHQAVAALQDQHGEPPF
jgi:hypothetical protein